MASPALTSSLRSGRTYFNARFAAARRIHPELEPDDFLQLLGTAVDGLAVAVEKVRADRLNEVIAAAFDAALELAGQKLAGPGSRLSVIEEAWNRILPAAAAVVAVAPGRVIPAVCNAAHQIASTAGARPRQWIAAMEALAPRCADPEVFLKLGVLCAWRGGLAHYRRAALEAADALDEALTLAALEARPGCSWPDLRERLAAEPWFDPAAAREDRPALNAVAQVGAFKGFGGLFLEPPLVASAEDRFFVRSDGECWLLTADVFGATFHRASIQEFDAAKGASRLPASLQVAGSRVAYQGEHFEFPELGEFTSGAASATTLALTSDLTHSILLMALR